MNVVSFYAPRPEHKLFQDYTPFLRVLDASCKKFGHNHIVISDKVLPGFNTFVAELPDDLMGAVLVGQLAYLESEFAKTDTIFIDGDCVLAKDPASVFDKDFDIAVITHADLQSNLVLETSKGFESVPFTDSHLDNSTIFIRGGADAAKFWRSALLHVGVEWGDDQHALAIALNVATNHRKLFHRLGVPVRFLPRDTYTFSPDHPGQEPDGSFVLHFRGGRKQWMVDYCAHHLGIGERIKAIAEVNVDNASLLRNIADNMRLPLPWLGNMEPHEGHAVLVGGGPSLEDTLPEIRWRASLGQTIFALNNAANYLVEHGITPDYQIVIDARPENVRFVKPLPAKKYLIASQCHPSVFEAVPADITTLFHCVLESGVFPPFPEGRDNVIYMGGGITSGLTATAVTFTMGYRLLHLYGYDSSDRGKKAHAYEQEESEAEKRRIRVWVNDKQFDTQFAMLKQAQGFQEFAQLLANSGATITVHGDGLLPTIARSMTTATLI